MRHVLTNSEIPHLWAHQTQEHARNGGNGSFYFRGATIYSWGSHFPIATYNKEYHHERAVELRKEALCYATFFGLADPAIDQVPDLNSEQMAAIKSREAKASAKKAAETKRKAEEDCIRWAAAAEQWRAGEYHHTLPYSLPTMLRIEGDEVVTSRGARFPISHAKRGLSLVRAVMARAEDWRRNGHSCHLGISSCRYNRREEGSGMGISVA